MGQVFSPDANLPMSGSHESDQSLQNSDQGDGVSCINYQFVEPGHLGLDQLRVRDELQRLRPLGLKLDISTMLRWQQHQQQPPFYDFASQPAAEKLKASSIPATLLKIGDWQRVARNASDLVAKCYFAKRKLVWEILDGRLKSKIEVQWSDIIAINASINNGEHGVLQIELNQQPTFHEETDPQPRKHTIWKPASDFTGGQAQICRRHLIMFPPGNLNRAYEKLLQCDQRLFLLSQKPFPSLQNPYFPTPSEATDYCLGYNPVPVHYIPPPSMAIATHLWQYRFENPSPISDNYSNNNNGFTMWEEQQGAEMLSGLDPTLDTTAYNMEAIENLYSSTAATLARYTSQIGGQLNGYLPLEFQPDAEELYQHQNPGSWGVLYENGIHNQGMEHFYQVNDVNRDSRMDSAQQR